MTISGLVLAATLSTGVEIPDEGVPMNWGGHQYTTRTEKRPVAITNEAMYLKWKWRMNLANPATGVDNDALREGVKKIVAMIRSRQPTAKLILHPIFPRGRSADSPHAAPRTRNDKTNALLKEFAERDGKVVWVDFNKQLVDGSGWVPASLMADEIHPIDAGYDIWMDALAPHISLSTSATRNDGCVSRVLH